jgi:hypothetical protein
MQRPVQRAFGPLARFAAHRPPDSDRSYGGAHDQIVTSRRSNVIEVSPQRPDVESVRGEVGAEHTVFSR